jgi:hypothetical protein
MAANAPIPARHHIRASGESVSPAATAHPPMPRKYATIIRDAPSLSPNIPAGKATTPTINDPSVHSSMSSW